MMQVQKFIEEKGWQALKDELAIEVKEYDCGLRVLNYNQIESPRAHPVADECRGLILDSQANVISRAFNRFYNYGEAGTKESFSFSGNTDVFEKADGSLIKVYWNPILNQWEISTRGSAFAEVNHVFSEANGGTFRGWVLNAMKMTEQHFQSAMNSVEFHKTCTYVFEYTGPENRIVTRYTDPMMVLLTVVSNVTGAESNLKGLTEWCEILKSKGMNVRLPKIYSISSVQGCIDALNELAPTEEGYVVFNRSTGQRVKIKSPAYLAMHRLRGNGAMTFNNMAELVMMHEEDEFLAVFDEYTSHFAPLIEARDKMIVEMTELFNDVKDIESQKDFAMKVKDTIYSGPLFKARKDGCAPKHALAQMNMTQQVELLRRYVNS